MIIFLNDPFVVGSIPFGRSYGLLH